MSTHAETAHESDEQPKAARPEPPPKASRQSIVVKPRSSSGPLFVCGALASAAAGFAIVFVSGLGRSDPDAFTEPSSPRLFVPAGEGQVADTDLEPAPLDRPGQSRFAATPVVLEDRAGDAPAPEASTVGFSRFSESAHEGDPGDAAEDTEPSLMPADGGSETAQSQETALGTDDVSALEPAAEDEGSLTAAPPVTTPPPATPPSQEPFAPVATTPPPTTSPQAESPRATPQSSEPSGLRAPPLESTFAAALAQTRPAASKPPAVQAASQQQDPGAPVPVTPPGGGPAFPPDDPAPPDLARSEVTRPDRIASTDVSRGFAGVPATTPAPTAVPSPSLETAEPARDGVAGTLSAASVGGAVQADGRPGPIQLEGIQTPQLTIEKRGPREVQVGKVARYDMVVRNVGGVSAHDVTLRDRVPLGTKLVSTSPPAAPGEAGELVWALGSLPQGGQARVAMEVMPVEEGEVGSVASVSFRADASVRSVATRAGLAIEAENPKPVLVSSTIELAITVRNPGSGEATGVVLEGNVPTGFTHASGPALEYDVGRLRPGEARKIDLKLVSTHPGVQKLKLSARADGQIETDQVVRLEVTAPTLELTANMPSRRYLQRPVTCVLSMNNAGTAPANTIELAAQLPPGMKFLRANNAGYYEESTNRVLWHLEQLPAAEVGSVEMVLVPTALGPQRIAAAARSADGLAAQVAHTIEVEGLAALVFDVGDSEDPIEVDGITEYVVRVGNQGTKAAAGVRVTATLLGDLEPVDAKGPAAHRIENLSVLFEPLANLAPAEESVYRIRVRGRREGDQRVQVQVTSDGSQSPITKEEVTRVYADR